MTNRKAPAQPFVNFGIHRNSNLAWGVQKALDANKDKAGPPPLPLVVYSVLCGIYIYICSYITVN